MSKRVIIGLLITSLLIFAAGNAFAQAVDATDTVDVNIEVEEVLAIELEGELVATFVVGGSPAAGALPEIDSTGATASYLQYTSTVAAAQTRSIDVSSNALPPAGLKLTIKAGPPTGHGGVGDPVAGGVTIDSTYTLNADLPLVSGITSCATGIGATQGAPIYYVLDIDEATFASMVTAVAANVMLLTFTITD